MSEIRTIPKGRAYHARPQLSEDPSENFQLIEDALSRVRERTERMTSFCKPSKKKGIAPQLGEPTPEREKKATHIQRDSLAPKDAPKVIRSVISAPMTLSATKAMVLAEVFDDLMKGKDALRNRSTPIDKASEDSELQALERYVLGTLASEGKAAITNYSGASHGSDTEKTPFTDTGQREIAARHFVYSRIPPAFQMKLDFFFALMCNRPVTVMEKVKGKEEPQERNLTLIDLGKTVARTEDARVAKGAYIATFRDVGQLLGDLYAKWEIDDLRRRQASADERQRRRLAAPR